MNTRLLLGALLLVGCGDDSSAVDAGFDAGVDASPDVGVDAADSGFDAGPAHCAEGTLLIAEVDPMTSITIFNAGPEAVDLTGTGWVFCQRPNYIQLEMIETGVTIPAGGTHVYPMPVEFSDQDDASGELVLYRTSAFTNPDAVIDYVCWGDGRSENRQSVAEEAGMWSGACASAITGTLRRRAGTDGRNAASYDISGGVEALTCP